MKTSNKKPDLTWLMILVQLYFFGRGIYLLIYHPYQRIAAILYLIGSIGWFVYTIWQKNKKNKENEKNK